MSVRAPFCYPVVQTSRFRMQGSMRYVRTRAAVPPDPSRSLEVTRPKRSASRRLLRKSDLENKLLITRTTGRQFGTVGEAWVEPRRLYVQSFDVIQKKTLSLSSEKRGSVALKYIREVGDVVLIHEDRDLTTSVLEADRRQIILPGVKLIQDNGTVIGRCVDFVFDPQTGRIVKLIFHTVNLAFAKGEWFDQYAINVQEISRIVLSQRVIYLRNEATWKKVGVGEYQFLANLVPSFSQEVATDDSRWLEQSDLQSQYQTLLEESRRQQADYSARYGTSRRSAARPPREKVRIDDWIKKEAREEQLFMQE